MVQMPAHPKDEGPESVNCNLPADSTHKNVDFHIPLARTAGATEYEAMVVEMIPQRRSSTWNIDTIRQVAAQRRPVIVRGQLLYDSKHVVNNDPAHPAPGQPKRFSLWEVHPITEFYVCPREACDDKNLAEWQAMGKVQP